MMAQDYKLLPISFALLNFANWLAWVDVKFGIPNIFKYVLFLFVILVITYYRVVSPNNSLRNDLLYPVIIFFLVWSLLLVLLSAINFDNLMYLRRVFADRFFFIPYILPVLILFTKYDLDFYHSFFKYSFVFLILAIIAQLSVLVSLSPRNWYEHFERINIFNIGSSFLLLTAHFSKRKYTSSIVLLFYILLIIVALVYGRRGSVVYSIALLMFMVLLRLRSSLLNISQRTKIYLVGLLIIFLFLTFGYLLMSTYAFERGFSKDAFEESRGAVFNDFFLDFTSIGDWVFGRGLQGTVFRSIYEEGTLGIIEQGFLTIILRGGLLYLIPFVLIFLRAIYLGLFRSRNDFIKALAVIVFLHIIMMFHFNLPDFSAHYVFVWISIATCYSPSMRDYTNIDIFKAINSKADQRLEV